MTFVAQTHRLLREWDAAVELTMHTSRLQLPDRVDKLQALHTRAGELPCPDCAVQIKALLVSGMGSTIQSLTHFIAERDVDVAWPEILRKSQHDIDVARHATNAMLEYSASWQPMMLDDVKQMLPQYTWENTTYRSGAAAIEAGASPVTIQAFHEHGIVYKVYVGAVMFDLAAYPAAWETISATASTLLPNWAGRTTWLAQFGAAEPADSEDATTEYIGVTAVRAQHSRHVSAGMEIASVEIYIPHHPAQNK
jgi:hypothetical protein